MTSFSPTTRSRLRQRLLAWFDQHQRDLPWRQTKDPYCVWISEIMLQQTQVATVIPYYRRFIARFPDPAALASADEQTVLQYWEGLGYYRRAKAIHRAARQIVTEHHGVFPAEFSSVNALPGIGRYTAGAILSIALNQPHPILEGNTVRVHSRLSDLAEDVSKSAAQRQLWQLAEQLVDPERPGDLNQALMELGSEICTPKQPRCVDCPVRQDCKARAAQTQLERPYSSQRQKFEDRSEAVVLIRRRGRILMRQCRADERWAGLWDFPRYLLDRDDIRQHLSQQVVQQTGLRVELRDTGWTTKHSVTRFRIRLSCWVAEKVAGRLAGEPALRWIEPDELDDLPLSVTGRKLACELPQLWDSRALFDD